MSAPVTRPLSPEAQAAFARYQHRAAIRRRNRRVGRLRQLLAFAGGLAGGVALAAMVWWGLSLASDPAPPCTASIADAGGICHGEPR